MNRSNVDGKKILEQLVQELAEAVTKDLLYEENLTNDFKQVHPVYKPSMTKRKETEKMCAEVKNQVKTGIVENFFAAKTTQQLLDKRSELENTKNSSRAAWRINGDPVHDTFAQRREVYLDHIKELKEEERKWDEKAKKRRAELEKLLTERNV